MSVELNKNGLITCEQISPKSRILCSRMAIQLLRTCKMISSALLDTLAKTALKVMERRLLLIFFSTQLQKLQNTSTRMFKIALNYRQKWQKNILKSYSKN